MASCHRMKSNKAECAQCETSVSANSRTVWQTSVRPAQYQAPAQPADVKPSCLFLSLGRNTHTIEKCKTSPDRAERMRKCCQQPSQTLLNSCLADHFSFLPDIFFPISWSHWSQEYDCLGITLMIMHFLYFIEQSIYCFLKKGRLQIFQT